MPSVAMCSVAARSGPPFLLQRRFLLLCSDGLRFQVSRHCLDLPDDTLAYQDLLSCCYFHIQFDAALCHDLEAGYGYI
ncbi:hypothetical protein U9M48_037130 [Paspalum notatum var. saurae]|uniref:Uncharacterized protein n=1 Tax=Paspalum notatum var. saurae TaxID=547442 RepID=A0AAQ3UJ08_PASNO